MTTPALAADPVLLHAAGSLRLRADRGDRRLRARRRHQGAGRRSAPPARSRIAIAKGERAEVFASANMEHPQALADAKKSGPVVLFARNRLCALVAPGACRDAGEPARPHARPGGEARDLDAEGRSVRRLCLGGVPQGRQAQARRRSRSSKSGRCKLVGAPTSAAPPKGRTAYGWHVAEGRADMFLTYCTNAHGGAGGELPASSSCTCPRRSRSAPTTG